MKFRSKWRHWSLGIWTLTRGKNSRSRNRKTEQTWLVLKCPSTGWSLLALQTPLTAPALISTKDNGELNLLAIAALHSVLSADSFSHDHTDAMTWSHTWYQTCKHTTNLRQPCFHRKLNQLKQFLPANLQYANSHWRIGLYCGNTASGSLVLSNTGKSVLLFGTWRCYDTLNLYWGYTGGSWSLFTKYQLLSDKLTWTFVFYLKEKGISGVE